MFFGQALFNEDLRKFWPISAFPQQNHPKSDRLLGNTLILAGRLLSNLTAILIDSDLLFDLRQTVECRIGKFLRNN
uniref:Uncharacterized protein n=1 Tax=Candidatus Kentrum sp. DK TaxID=2126562 RepID=A0A450TMI5_9GAMM|nr:MAG: hypothetical protein BECKDK2373B_GA0170837_12284 [Candidatus Kentron sp. DK]